MVRLQALKQQSALEHTFSPTSSGLIEGSSFSGIPKMHPLKSSNPVLKASSMFHNLLKLPKKFSKDKETTSVIVEFELGLLIAIVIIGIFLGGLLDAIKSGLFRLVQLENRAMQIAEQANEDHQANMLKELNNEYAKDYENFQQEHQFKEVDCETT